MSKIKVNSLEGVGASTPAISIDNASGTCTANITNNLSNRNKVINGSMVCSQRGVTFSPDNTEQPYTLDRFQHVATSGADGDCTVTQATDTPDEFSNSYKVTPDATNTPTGGGNVVIRHRIEGQNLQDLAYGTSSAKSLSVSFYAKTSSENSGDQYTLCLFYFRSDGTGKTVTVAFTPTSTWQRFSFTFAGDTDASYGIRNDNNTGMSIMWVLASGPNDIMAAKSTWEADGAYFRAVTGQNNFMDNTNNEFYLTGVQLEVGSVATDFEHRSFAQELALCQRYFYMHASGAESSSTGAEAPIGLGYGYTSSDCYVVVKFPVTMRAYPSMYKVVGTDYFRFAYNNNNAYPDNVGNNRSGTNSAEIYFYSGSSWDQNAGGMVRINDSNARVGFTAEL